MEDIDSLLQFSSLEHALFEKETNLFSIIKTIDFLVSGLFLINAGIRVHVRQGLGIGVRQRIQVTFPSVQHVFAVDSGLQTGPVHEQVQSESLPVGKVENSRGQIWLQG